MRKFLLALAAVILRVLDALAEWERKQEERKQKAEIERLRNDSVQWWQDNFGAADVGDDVRLRDAAREATDAAPPSARDRTG